MIDYPKLINEYRQIKCLTQEEFAKILNVSSITVSRWEQGKFEPTMQIKKVLRKLFIEAKLIEE